MSDPSLEPPSPPSAPTKVDTVVERVHDTVKVAPPSAPPAAPPAARPLAPPTAPPARPSAIVTPVVPKPKPEASPPAPPPVAPPVDAARNEIVSLVSDYASALESRNLAHVRAAYPGLTPQQAQQLGDFLARAKDLHANIRVTEFSHDGDRAEATLEATYEYFDLKAGHEDRRTVTLHAVFSGASGNWRIMSLE